jgi:hypothetical protein
MTKKFYEHGWRGINIEPLIQYWNDLAKDRPEDTNLCCAVGNTISEFKLCDIEFPELAITNREVMRIKDHQRTLRKVSILTLASICNEYADDKDIHLLKIDAGNDARKVLAGMNLSRFRPWILAVEATEPNSLIEDCQKLESALIVNQYSLAYVDGLNQFYVANERSIFIEKLSIPLPSVRDNFFKVPQISTISTKIRADEDKICVRNIGIQTIQAEVRAPQAENEVIQFQNPVREAEMSAIQVATRAEQDKISCCRALAPRCVFIIGFARSNTSIFTSILNTAPNAMILHEANFWRYEYGGIFPDDFNLSFEKLSYQLNKQIYAPNFVCERGAGKWWQWLNAASAFYDVIGEKIAISSNTLFSHHANKVIELKEIRFFFERHFFSARYLLLLRNPINSLLSLSKHHFIDTNIRLIHEIVLWCRYIQLWADWIRIFPHTLTLVTDDLTPNHIKQVSSFTGLALEKSESMLNEEKRHIHKIPSHFPSLVANQEQLLEIFDLAKAALSEPKSIYLSVMEGKSSRRPSYALSAAYVKASELCAKLIGENPKSFPDEEIFLPGAVEVVEPRGSVIVIHGVKEVKAGSMLQILVELFNASSTVWTSNFKVFLSYHWHDNVGSVVVQEGIRTPLVNNLSTNERIRQNIFILSPAEPGIYRLVITVLQENIRWFENECTFSPAILEMIILNS